MVPRLLARELPSWLQVDLSREGLSYINRVVIILNPLVAAM